MDIKNKEDIKEYQRGQPAQAKDFESDLDDGSTSARTDDGKKNSHNEIEKRRRDKLNMQITELARILPMPSCRSRKLDRLSVLKMTVDYMKATRGVASSYTDNRHKHPLISDQEINNLVTQIAEGFVFAVSCDRGEIIYMSKSVQQILRYLPEDLVKNSLFDYIHPKDISKLMEQLFYSGVMYTDSKIKEDTYKIYMGTRRSFFCRMKRKEQFDGKNDAYSMNAGSNNDQPGYLKPWNQVHKCDSLFIKNLDVEEECSNVEPTLPAFANVLCLVAVGRVVDNSASTSNLSGIVKPTIRFDFKFTVDGKFIIVDPNITFIVGFLPQELLGTSVFEYLHPDDVPRLINVHKATLQDFNSKNTESSVKSESSSRGLLSQSNLFGEQQSILESQYLQPNIVTLESQIKSHLEACRIGECVANTYYLDKKKEVFDTKSTSSLQTQHNFTEEASDDDVFQAVFNDPCTSSSRGGDTFGSNCAVSSNSVIQDNVHLASMTSTYGKSVEDVLSDVMTSPSQPWSGSDTNEGVDMAVLMNMLEAEAGFGGPIDHSGFPWPLP